MQALSKGQKMRINARKLSEYPLFLRPFFWNQKRKYGVVLDAALMWARSPKLFTSVAILYGMVDRKRSPLNPALRSLVTVLVSQINSCSFCVDLNSAILLKRGVSDAVVQSLSNWKESEMFDPAQKAALDYADAVTKYDRGVNDQLFAELHKYYDDDAIIELTGLIAFQNLSSKFNSALDVPAQGFCQISSTSQS